VGLAVMVIDCTDDEPPELLSSLLQEINNPKVKRTDKKYNFFMFYNLNYFTIQIN
jgi:hypothetical protein